MKPDPYMAYVAFCVVVGVIVAIGLVVLYRYGKSHPFKEAIGETEKEPDPTVTVFVSGWQKSGGLVKSIEAHTPEEVDQAEEAWGNFHYG